MSLIDKLYGFFNNGGSATQNDLASRFNTSREAIRATIFRLRQEGMPIGKVLPAKTLIARYQLTADYIEPKRGRPAYVNAVKV